MCPKFWLVLYFCMNLALWTGALSCWNRKRPAPNCCHIVGSTESSRMSLHAVVSRYPFTGTKGPSFNHDQHPRPLFLPHKTLQLALCIGEGSVLLASSNPKFIRWTARWWSLIHHSRDCVSSAPESNGAKLYTTPANAWHCAWWS